MKLQSGKQAYHRMGTPGSKFGVALVGEHRCAGNPVQASGKTFNFTGGQECGKFSSFLARLIKSSSSCVLVMVQ
jgi:hypothetical protein